MNKKNLWKLESIVFLTNGINLAILWLLSFASGTPQNNHKSMQIVSNESFFYFSLFFIKINILNQQKVPLEALKLNFLAVYSRNLALFWLLFCFWEASKWSQISEKGLKWKFLFFLTISYQNNLLESIKSASWSFKVKFFSSLQL